MNHVTRISESQQRRAIDRVNRRDDPMAPAFGIAVALLLSIPLWVAIGVALAWWLT